MYNTFALLPHGWEIFGIIFLVVLLFGADKIPKLARGVGRSLGEFRKAKDDFEREIHSAGTVDEAKKLAEQNNPTILPPTLNPGPVKSAEPAKTSEGSRR